LRPPELLRARAEHQAGRLSLEELRRVEDAAIGDVARIQQEIGLEGVTDGEFRRGSWHMDFLYQIGGVAKTDQALRIQFRNEARPVEAALHLVRTEPPCTLARPACVGPFFNPVRASGDCPPRRCCTVDCAVDAKTAEPMVRATLRWRETDSNPRSPVRGTTLFETARSTTSAIPLPRLRTVPLNSNCARYAGVS
jgi:hypothetical protein